MAQPDQVSLTGQDVIVVQATASRLGMYLMGQAWYSADLLAPFRPASVKSVALCGADDSELRPLAERDGIEIVVLTEGKGELGHGAR